MDTTLRAFSSSSTTANGSMFNTTSSLISLSRMIPKRSFTRGLSFQAETHNTRHEEISSSSLRLDVTEIKPNVMMSSVPSLQVKLPPQVFDGPQFKQEMEGAMSSIENLKCRHDAFQGKPLGLSFGAKASLGVKQVDEDDAGEETDHLQERLEAYKFHRKFEGELPPMVLNFMAPRDKRRKDQSLVLRNLDPKTIQS